MVWGRSASSGVEDLVKRLQANDPVLRSLTILRFRRLNDEDVAQLSQAIQNNNVLQELICCSHAISSEAAALLGNMLQQNQYMQRISIGNSTLGDEALAALVSGGLHQNRSLRVWDLEHKGLSSASAASIATVLQQHPFLQQLQLSRNSLADAGLRQLCAGQWASLAHLELAACDLTHQALPGLATAPSIAQLQHLDLSHNNLGPQAASTLADLLANATQLQSLKLKSTNIKDEGVQGIAEGLQRAAPLTVLDLSNNQLSNSGVAALASAIAQRTAATASAAAGVQHLVLADNPAIDDEAVSKLAHSFALPSVSPGAPAAEAGTAGTQILGLDNEMQEQQEALQVPFQQQPPQQQQLLLDLGLSGVGPAGVAALSKVAGLVQLSLFGCKLGGKPGAAVDALVDSIKGGGFASLKALNLTGCGLTLPQTAALVNAIAAGGQCLPQLVTLELGANSAAQEDGFEDLIAQLRAARPGLDVHWRAADSDAPPEW